MATNRENVKERMNDHLPAAKIDWSKPGAPAVPQSGTAGVAVEQPTGDLPISRSTYGSFEDCEREQARRDAAHLASQSQAAQPTDTTDEATKWAETYYRNADAFTFRDLGIVQAAWAEATRRAHLAGTSQATKAQSECPTCGAYTSAACADAGCGERATKAQAEPKPFRQAIRAIQAIDCPYNEKDHGTLWYASAHAWDMAMIEAIRAINKIVDAAPVAKEAREPEAPAILEAISYHARERDDLTLEEAVEAFRFGYKKVHERTVRAMLLQLIDLMASAPATVAKEAEKEQQAHVMPPTRGTDSQLDAGAAVLSALRDGVPLQEPVYITKAMLAQREARVSLSGGTGPVACAMLVNIQLTPWADGPEKAEAFASGYNTAMKLYRAALLEVAEKANADAASRFRAQGGITNTESSDIAPTTSTVSATATSRELDIIRTMVFSVDQFAALGNPDDPAPWALNSPVVLAARRLCYEYGYETGNFIAAPSSTEGTQAAPEEVLDKAVAECRKIVAKYVDKASEGKINSIRRNRNNWKVDAARECCDAINALRTTSTDQANADTGSAA